MISSHDPAIQAALDRAEATLERHADGARFHTVRAAIRWGYRAARNLREPIPDLVRRNARYQHVSVDGGKGSSIEDALVMVATIGQAMAMLHRIDGGKLKIQLLELAYRDGLTQAEIAKAVGRSQSWVSEELSRAEMYLLGILQQGGVVTRGGPVRRSA